MRLDKRLIKEYSSIVMLYFEGDMSSIPVLYKVDINPSYDWSEDAKDLNISHRELEVFALVTEGYKNKEIAQILKIKHQSVKTHMHNFTKKLGVKNNAQALIIAIHLKLLKVRAKVQDVTGEVKDEYLIKGMQELISDEAWQRGINEKEKRLLKVFLKEHGIDPYNW